jgi:ATP-dependent helicase/nuclease subunit A
VPLAEMHVPSRPARVRPSRGAPASGGTAAGPASAPSRTGALDDAPRAAEALPPTVRGDLIHRLIAGLSDLPPPERTAGALRLLRQAAPGLTVEAEAELVAEALGVVGHPELSELFAPGSVAEVPVVGRWTLASGREIEVSGRIDRLARHGARLLVADFKTDRVPPDGALDVGAPYVTQLALYAEALRRAIPGVSVEAMIVYTRAPAVLRIAGQRIAEAIARMEGA